MRKLDGNTGGTGPVCWRCMKRPVPEPGDECRKDCPALRVNGRPQGSSPRQIPVRQMSNWSKEREIEALASSQHADSDEEHVTSHSSFGGEIPGNRTYRDHVYPRSAVPNDARRRECGGRRMRHTEAPVDAPRDLREEGPIYPVRAWNMHEDPED